MKSHYVPQLTLRKFGESVCTYNVRTGEYRENVRNDRAFCEKDFYSDEIEQKLNKRIESQFGSLFANKLDKCSDEIVLSREELRLIKKFLLVSVIRSVGNEDLMKIERNYYVNLKEYAFNEALQKGMTREQAEAESNSNDFEPPFVEKQIDGENSFDYWMRTLDVILNSDGTPEDILTFENKTYPAHRWAKVINNGYLAFWDAETHHNEFVITDVGMTSENEKGWNGYNVHNRKKTEFLANLLMNEKNEDRQIEIYRYLDLHSCFTENFMMFPISAKRMIVEIDPFYKFRQGYANYYKMPELSTLTELTDENLFAPNTVQYVLPQGNHQYSYHPDDKYIYQVKKLTAHETQYCNALFLDRIDTYCGFSSLGKAVKSILLYKRLNAFPFTPRVDYSNLYRIIENRYGGTIRV